MCCVPFSGPCRPLFPLVQTWWYWWCAGKSPATVRATGRVYSTCIKQRESDRRSPGRLLSNKCRTASIVRTGGLTGWSRLTDGPSRSDFGFQGFCSESSVGRHGRRRGRLMPEPSSPKNHKLLFVSFQSKVLVTLRCVPHSLPPKVAYRHELHTAWTARGEIRRESSPSGRRPASPWGH